MNPGLLFMKKIILSLFAFAAFSATAKQHTYPVTYSPYANFSGYPVNRIAATETRKVLAKALPGWSAITDRLNGTITTAYGPAVDMPGSTVADKAMYCMEQTLTPLGINKNDWQQVSNITTNNKTYLTYGQVLNGHKVFMSRLSFQFTDQGQLLKIQMKNYGAADNKLTPTITAADALATAVSGLAGITVSTKQADAQWDWFPLPSASGYALRPSWHFTITGNKAGMPVKLVGYVDGITGELLYRTSEIKDNYNVQVKGTVYKNGTLNATSLESLPDIKLNIGANTYVTDTAGFYSNTALALPVSTVVPLAGLWSVVHDDTSSNIVSFTDVVSAVGSVYTYPTLAPSNSRDVNAYYHVNRVHNFMKGYLPTFTGMDFPLPTNVDVSLGNCNAYYDGSSINFLVAGGGCNSFAPMGDVVYHEYGHGITDHMYTNITSYTIQNAALNEAISDTWALSITHNPILAANAYTTYQGFIRRYDMTPQLYPQDLVINGDPHENGQMIVGSWWDVGVNIGSVDTMTRLFSEVYFSAPDGPDGQEGEVYQTVLTDALMADDNDHNLNNGTPHYKQIVAAFAKHGIYLEQDVTCMHQEVNNAPAKTPIPLTVQLSVENPTFMHQLLAYYRNHTSTHWDSVVMTTADQFNYTATIPGQDTGVLIDYYFCIRDGLNVPNAYFPIGYNPAIPAYQSTIPYQFGVGMVATDSTKFDAVPTGWSVGNVTGDNASSGKWQCVVPVPNGMYNAWPQTDHTLNNVAKCLLTGNGGGNGTHVTNGTTSVTTPVINISTYSEPVIEYYRWFSNDLAENFKNDPWQVMIKDASTTTWMPVEKTYQSDYNWRRRIFSVYEFLPRTTTSIQVKFMASDSVLTNWVNNGQSLTVGGVDDFYMFDAKKKNTAVSAVSMPKAKIYPNPADKQVAIVFPDNTSTPFTINIFDMAGKTVYAAQSTGQSNYRIDVSQLAPGVYNVWLQAADAVQCQKVVVAHN